MLEVAAGTVGALPIIEVPIVAQVFAGPLHTRFDGLGRGFVFWRQGLVQTLFFLIVVCPFLVGLGLRCDRNLLSWWKAILLANGGPG